MEQVAYVKLLHIGDALEAGVNILVLDLDVGFLRDPLLLVSRDCRESSLPRNLPLNLLLQMPHNFLLFVYGISWDRLLYIV